MKIAIFYPKNVLASWYTLGGYRQALEAMGHNVVDCQLPGNEPHSIEQIRAMLPNIQELNVCDVVISFFHEYTQRWLEAIYGDNWMHRKFPVIARFDESMDRLDLGLPKRVPELLKWADFYSWPAAQDAERFGGDWLPFGADVTKFCPSKTRWREPNFLYGLAFIGSMYKLRLDYLQRLSECVPNDVTFHCGQCLVQDLSGIRGEQSTWLLSENYRQIKVFFCLPPMSRLLVCKVFEVMGSGTFLMYPKLPGNTAKNLEIFEDGKHLVYYEPGSMMENAEQIKYWLKHDREREQIALAGCQLVHEKYTLKHMLDRLLAPVGVAA